MRSLALVFLGSLLVGVLSGCCGLREWSAKPEIKATAGAVVTGSVDFKFTYDSCKLEEKVLDLIDRTLGVLDRAETKISDYNKRIEAATDAAAKESLKKERDDIVRTMYAHVDRMQILLDRATAAYKNGGSAYTGESSPGPEIEAEVSTVENYAKAKKL